MKGYYYLAHPFSYRHESRLIEQKLEKELGINIFNPFYESWEKTKIELMDRKQMKMWEVHKAYTNQELKKIVKSDMNKIDKSKGVFFIVPYHRVSYGSIMEAFYAKLILKPVYTICYKKALSHPWLTYVSTVMSSTPDEMIKKLLTSVHKCE